MPITGTADRRLGTRAAWTGRSAGWGIYLALCGADALPVAIGRAPGSAPPHRALTAARRERRMCGVCGVVILCFAMPRILPMQEPRTHVRACACDLSHCVHAPCAVRFTCGPRGKVNASQQHTAPTARGVSCTQRACVLFTRSPCTAPEPHLGASASFGVAQTMRSCLMLASVHTKDRL